MMMRYLSLVPIAIFSLALQGQTGNPTSGPVQSGQPATAAAAPVSAELTKRIDVKKAKVGDEVDVKTTSNAKLPDGTDLPKGTKLIGKVTDVHAKSNTDKTSHLAFDLDRAVTKDGHEVPVHAAVTSVLAPAQPAESAYVPGGGAGGGGAAAGGGGGTSGSSGSSGGTAPAPASASVPVASSSDRPASTAQVARGPQDQVPVANMPGVVLTSADGLSSAGSLDAANQNFSLDSGTKMTLNVLPGQR
jgi:hypothetical protein